MLKSGKASRAKCAIEVLLLVGTHALGVMVLNTKMLCLRRGGCRSADLTVSLWEARHPPLEHISIITRKESAIDLDALP